MNPGDLRFRLASAGYNVLLHLMIPGILLHFVWRSRREPGYRQHLLERVTGKQHDASACDLWIHAVSLGEMRAAGHLIRALVAGGGSTRIQLTTATPAGRAEAKRMQAAGLPVHVRYLPLDLPWALRRLFRALQPKVLVLIETELWPNLLRASARADVPVIVVNARLSPGLRASYRKLRILYAPLLSGLTAVAAQSASDATAFRALGAPRVSVTGNLKFDVDPPRPGELQREAFAGDWLWLAGSTHPGEETTLFETHRALCRRHADRRLQLLVAPRHPDRAPEILAQARAAGLSAIPRSTMAFHGNTADVIVLDTLGELAGLYALADAAFVGGSLVDHGGQNPLEPAAAGCPVIAGPDMRNFAHAVALLEAARAILPVKNAAGLLEALDDWVRDPDSGTAMAARAAQVLEANRGATGHTLDVLKPWLHERGSTRDRRNRIARRPGIN